MIHALFLSLFLIQAPESGLPVDFILGSWGDAKQSGAPADGWFDHPCTENSRGVGSYKGKDYEFRGRFHIDTLQEGKLVMMTRQDLRSATNLVDWEATGETLTVHGAFVDNGEPVPNSLVVTTENDNILIFIRLNDNLAAMVDSQAAEAAGQAQTGMVSYTPDIVARCDD